MNYYPMTTKQLEQEHSALQVKVRNASPSEYWEELAKLGRVQAILSDRYAQSVKAQLEQEHSALQVKVRNASPSEYWEELAKLGRVQAILSDRYAQSVKAHIAERATSRR
jgi:hypothetical protein